MTPILDLICIAAAFRWRGMFHIPTPTLQDMLKKDTRGYLQWAACYAFHAVTSTCKGISLILDPFICPLDQHLSLRWLWPCYTALWEWFFTWRARLGIVLRHPCGTCHRGARWNLEQADEISSSFHSHRTSSIIRGGRFLATKRFKVLVSCWIRTWVRSWNADHFSTWTGEYAKCIWHRSNGEYLIASIVWWYN